jgi:C4-dicarboxylate-specific signal transduction histidine kinase
LAPDAEDEGSRVAEITRTLLGIANASFDHRAPRSYDGGRWDVLAFLVNSTADEVSRLVSELASERRELERTQSRLLQAEKLAAVGRLSAGVAHEMNQPLTIISSLVGLIATRPEATVAEREPELALIADAARHMSRIVDSVRTFGRGASGPRLPVPARAAVDSAAALLSPRLRDAGVALAWDVEPDLPLVAGDVDRLRQVFLNLLGNAVDALRAAGSDAPRIQVRVAFAGGFVRFVIEDNGPGIDPRDLVHIFEPFFSTKPTGEGTGLGLCIALGIVTDHGGTLEFQPVPTGGSRFVVRIPAAAGAP